MVFGNISKWLSREKMIKCAKCGKEKKESEGTYILDGTAFCCKTCCGDPAKGENKKAADKICEFC